MGTIKKNGFGISAAEVTGTNLQNGTAGRKPADFLCGDGWTGALLLSALDF